MSGRRDPGEMRRVSLLGWEPSEPGHADAVEGWKQSGDVVLTVVMNDLRSSDGQGTDAEAIVVDAEVERVGRAILGVQVVGAVSLVAEEVV